MKKRWMGLVMALVLLAAVFPGRVGAREAAAETGGVCYPTLAGALEALESGGTLTLLRDETLAAMLALNKNGTTLDLNEYSLAPAAEFSGSHDNARHLVEAAGTGITVKNGTLRAGAGSKHLLNVYGAEDLVLENVILDHEAAGYAVAPLVITGATARLRGQVTLRTGANSWYGMNLDDRVYGESRPCGVTVEGRLHFAGPAALGALLDQSLGGAVRLAFAAGSRVSAEQDGFPAAVIGPTASGAQLIDPENGGLTRVESEQGIFYLTGAAESAPEPAPTPSPEPDPTAQPTAAPPAAPTASPSPTLPARTETQTVTVTARVESEAEAGVAAARPDPQTVRAGVAQALEQAAVLGLAPAVRLELDETEEAPALAVTLPAAELRPLAETEDARLVVAALAAEVTLDGTALRTALEGARESLVLTVAPAEAHTLTEAQRQAAGEHAVFSLTLHRDGVEVTDFGGGSARVSLPHTLAEGRREEEVAVWHLDEEGGADPRDCVYEEGRVTFTTPHFFHYAVGYWPAEEPLILETQPPAAAPAALAAWWAVVAGAGAVLALAALARRRGW